MANKLPYQMDELELVARHLKRRAEFWRQFPSHRNTARALDNEARLIALGHHKKMLPSAVSSRGDDA